ncbi:MAG: hypothetical protein MZW92_11915 [Comamonadaceae bacterium]|nr:hypothetical protein [Comamonadaceae bacterium]
MAAIGESLRGLTTDPATRELPRRLQAALGTHRVAGDDARSPGDARHGGRAPGSGRTADHARGGKLRAGAGRSGGRPGRNGGGPGRNADGAGRRAGAAHESGDGRIGRRRPIAAQPDRGGWPHRAEPECGAEGTGARRARAAGAGRDPRSPARGAAARQEG